MKTLAYITAVAVAITSPASLYAQNSGSQECIAACNTTYQNDVDHCEASYFYRDDKDWCEYQASQNQQGCFSGCAPYTPTSFRQDRREIQRDRAVKTVTALI